MALQHPTNSLGVSTLDGIFGHLEDHGSAFVIILPSKFGLKCSHYNLNIHSMANSHSGSGFSSIPRKEVLVEVGLHSFHSGGSVDLGHIEVQVFRKSADVVLGGENKELGGRVPRVQSKKKLADKVLIPGSTCAWLSLPGNQSEELAQFQQRSA